MAMAEENLFDKPTPVVHKCQRESSLARLQADSWIADVRMNFRDQNESYDWNIRTKLIGIPLKGFLYAQFWKHGHNCIAD